MERTGPSPGVRHTCHRPRRISAGLSGAASGARCSGGRSRTKTRKPAATSSVRAARPRKPWRQPTVAAIQASGVAAASVPMLEAANTHDSAVASRAGANQREHRNTTDMNEAAQPTPTMARPAIRSVASVARAIHSAPAMASSESAATVRRAPNRSNSRPTGICTANSAKKKALPAQPSWRADRSRSRVSSGAITLLETR